MPHRANRLIVDRMVVEGWFRNPRREVSQSDNWWQVEDNFVRSLGRASELYGQETLLDDYLARALEISRRSVEEYERAPEHMKTLYDAYAEGLNFFLREHPEVEPRLLARVEPWHTLALIRFKYHHNEYIGYAGLRRTGTELLLERPDVRAVRPVNRDTPSNRHEAHDGITRNRPAASCEVDQNVVEPLNDDAADGPRAPLRWIVSSTGG